MTVALTGGTGFVGQAMLDVLARRGMPARSLARQVPTDRRQNVEWVGGDLADHRALRRLATGAEVLVHIAGLTHAPDPAKFEAVNVQGTLNVVEAAVAAAVPRFVYVSSLAAREPELSEYGASKLRAEKIVMASGLDWTIVRPPAIYGPRDHEIFEMFRMARLGFAPVPRGVRMSVIHVHDLCEAIASLLPTGEQVTRRIFEPDDGRANGWESAEFVRAIGTAMGKTPRVPQLSRGTLSLVARADKLLRGDNAKLTPDRVGYMTHPDWVSRPEKAIPKAIWQPRLPTAAGLKSTAGWYKKHGWFD